jgi:hypothetical protein
MCPPLRPRRRPGHGAGRWKAPRQAERQSPLVRADSSGASRATRGQVIIHDPGEESLGRIAASARSRGLKPASASEAGVEGAARGGHTSRSRAIGADAGLMSWSAHHMFPRFPASVLVSSCPRRSSHAGLEALPVGSVIERAGLAEEARRVVSGGLGLMGRASWPRMGPWRSRPARRRRRRAMLLRDHGSPPSLGANQPVADVRCADVTTASPPARASQTGGEGEELGDTSSAGAGFRRRRGRW